MSAYRHIYICIVVTLALGSQAGFAALDPWGGRLVPGSWKAQWTSTLTSSLRASGLLMHDESEIDRLCTHYANDGRRRILFWNQLMISLSWKESLFGPRNYIDFHGGRNEGLFQLDPRLRRAYGCGPIDLFNAFSNIRCAVKMAARLTAKFGSFLTGSKGGMAAYWQPLRATSSANRRNRNSILTSARTACRIGKLKIPGGPEISLIGDFGSDETVPNEIVPNTIDDLMDFGFPVNDQGVWEE